jgi:hypothetical protein
MNTKIAKLKSEAYDLIAQIEAHQIHVVKLQKMLQEKNEEIKAEQESQENQNSEQ